MQSNPPANRRSLSLLGRAHVEWGYGFGNGRLKRYSNGWIWGRCQGPRGLRKRHSHSDIATPTLMAVSGKGRGWLNLQLNWGGVGDLRSSSTMQIRPFGAGPAPCSCAFVPSASGQLLPGGQLARSRTRQSPWAKSARCCKPKPTEPENLS